MRPEAGLDIPILVAIMLRNAGKQDELATADAIASFMSVLMVGAAFAMKITPRELAELLFKGLPDSEDSWVQLRARMLERLEQVIASP